MEAVAKALLDKPYKVIDNQKKFQELPGPVYLKTATDRLVFRGAVGLAVLGVAGIAYSVYRMTTATGKKQRF